MAPGVVSLLMGCGSGRIESPAPPTQATLQPGLAAASPAPRDAATNGDPVRGSLVDENQVPLSGRVVAIGGARTTTDADGHFMLGAPRVYDLVVAEPSGERATVYLGLHRRDPLLIHKRVDAWRPAHRATISGRVEGAPFSQTNQLNLSFASQRASAQTFLGTPGSKPGPEIMPFVVVWNGPAVISGQLTATRSHLDPLDPSDAGSPDAAASRRRPWDRTFRTTSWVAQQDVTLHDGETVAVDLAPVPRPRLQTHVRLNMPPGVWPTELGELYGFRKSHAVIAGGGAPLKPGATEFDLDIVDARGLGGTLCAMAAFGYGRWILTRSCDLPFDRPAIVTLHASPSLTTPAAGSPLRPDTSFAWSASDGVVFELELRDNSPTASDPAVDLYTTETRAQWPDLQTLGVAFPTGSASYSVKIAARGPYATMDDAVGPEGMGVPFPKELWLAESAGLELRTEPLQPVGSQETQCQYPYGTAIVCGNIPNNIEQNKEFYMLAAINNKLRHYPELANATGIHCVRDCQGARAYMKAYATYAGAHPGFDANEPIEMP